MVVVPARAYVTDADGARPLVVEPDSPLGRAWEGDETFTEAAGESRVEAAREEMRYPTAPNTNAVRAARRAIEQAVSEKARDEAVTLLRDWLLWESDPISSRTLGDIAGDTAHFLARLAASPTEEANRG